MVRGGAHVRGEQPSSALESPRLRPLSDGGDSPIIKAPIGNRENESPSLPSAPRDRRTELDRAPRQNEPLSSLPSESPGRSLAVSTMKRG